MNRGIVIYAHNNTAIDYGRMALCAAALARTNMSKPEIALITDEATLLTMREGRNRMFERVFSEVIITTESARNLRQYKVKDKTISAKYRNLNRPSVYELSPFDHTLVLDADYLVLDSTLDLVWKLNGDLMMNRRAVYLDFNEMPGTARLDPVSIPMYWATAFAFRKGPIAEQFFRLVNHIRDNFEYYGRQFRFEAKQYRNDFSFSIAAHMLNGEIENGIAVRDLPVGELPTIYEPGYLAKALDTNTMVFAVPNGDKFLPVRMRQNVHCMSKMSILEVSGEILSLCGAR